MGARKDRAKTKKHNEKWTECYPQAVEVLNRNMVAWLDQQIVIDAQNDQTGVRPGYIDCLDAPNYTVFSNTSVGG